ncbi:hypothetical protein ACVRXQ_06500 [Streptococcus panodentis]|uniref:Diguanylate cyclase n=1 Tax=Streptococcus panodentis TaxID=1581472 RepID=A0ABS5AVB2_9STRE|nr:MULTISPECIES: hypothetical protein [Streptococcus]KXT83222.1 hypothetical protein STRDD11_01623 [Streptococcus sp. DD11]MBP2620495.1 hypothetical protein [Streptococcus panodentis]
MFRKRALEGSLLLLVLAAAAVLVYSWFFATSIFYVVAALILLGIFSVFVLSDLLVSWIMILGIVFTTVILIFDVAYLPDNDIFLLLYTFSVSAWLASRVNHYLHERFSLVQDDSEEAAADYDELVQKIHLQEQQSFQALLIHWTHNRHFFQINTHEYKRMLKQIHRLLKWSFQDGETLYYVSNGNFLVLTSRTEQNLRSHFQERVQADLITMHFKNKTSRSHIQFQSGYLEIDADNVDRFHRFEDALSNLERQLETDIIIEY